MQKQKRRPEDRLLSMLREIIRYLRLNHHLHPNHRPTLH